MEIAAIILGKCVGFISNILKLGVGGTWPGEIALRLRPNILSDLAAKLRKGVIIVAGTNGKTTTAKMIQIILEHKGNRVVHNASGANLDNGIVSALIQGADWTGSIDADWGVFEVDENSLPIVIKFIKSLKLKVILVLLNLFRDQLDRYGEVDVIAEKWEKAFSGLSRDTTLIANADDPLIAHLGLHAKLPIQFFGITDKTKYLSKMEHATDSIFCLNCGARLKYDGVYFSHIGIWKCPTCGENRPNPTISEWKSPLPGLYNQYNTLAAVAVAKSLHIQAILQGFQPSFGRQEEFIYREKKIKIFLSKNPVGFNMSLRTVLEAKPQVLLLALNDRIPDGRDVSWIWDVDFEMIPPHMHIVVSGDRTFDLAIRMKYADLYQKSKIKNQKYKARIKNWKTMMIIEPDLRRAIRMGLNHTKKSDVLYILPTYSAMLDIRKILIGRKIL